MVSFDKSRAVLALLSLCVISQNSVCDAFTPSTQRKYDGNVVGVSSFVATTQRRSLRADLSKKRQQFLSTKTSSSSTQLKMVFERMSEDCIGALVTAQQEATRLNLKQVGTEVLMAGIVDHPEHRAMDRTLAKYGITWRKVTKTLTEMYSTSDSSGSGSGGGMNLGMFKSPGTQTKKGGEGNLPFATPAKKAMARAGTVADKMGSSTVQSHHLLLALLEYEEDADGNISAATVKDGVCECGALAVILKLDGMDSKIQAVDICNTVLEQIQAQGGVSSNDRGELVTGADAGTLKTPTLEECGTDLTQLARDGMLDPVYGRDAEIESAMRTLVRRRKNNVCLMGEAGVGKTAIAEGIAQMLVDNPPPRLAGTRLISLEIASLVAGTKYRGEFEERLQNILKELTDPKAPPTILFLDEIHTLVGAGMCPDLAHAL